ncbi:hypothetical protein [Undibacterium sp. SXout20W]|uniref:hypothetical protein n=1 Tax=Undibacterium sp. SXout20W TaxID=3413051 RepID=UPI003BF1D663
MRFVQSALMLSCMSLNVMFVPVVIAQEQAQVFSDGSRYQGGIQNGNMHGKGLMIWADGGRYEGDFVNGSRTGKGVYRWASGDEYSGDFLNNLLHGQGTLTWANGNRYEGDFVSGQRTGKGKYTWKNGDGYEGDFVDGRKQGKGVLRWQNQQRYEGDFQADQRTGQGTFYWPDGSRYEGEFKNNERSGQGKLFFSDGNRYEGTLLSGVLNGKGSYFWTNGSRYDGEFVDGKRNGKGVYQWQDGRRYEGGFLNNMRTGYGVFTDNNYRYEGNFEEEKQHGAGVEQWQNGSRYEGNFSHGVKDGAGTLTTVDGKQTSQIWQAGRLISPQPQQVAEIPEKKPELKAKKASPVPVVADPQLTLIEAAVKDFEAGRYPHAAKKYRQLLETYPDNAMAWYFLGQTQEKMDEKVPALKSYRRALRAQSQGVVADLVRQALERIEKESADADAKLLARFAWDYQFEPVGRREWRMINQNRWLEVYPDGSIQRFDVQEVAQLGGCNGMLVAKESERDFQIFIPFNGCEKMWLRFRRGSGEWLWLGEMKEIEWR